MQISRIRLSDKTSRLCFRVRRRLQFLAGDTIGDAIAFFGISESELHNFLCFCHYGETMSAEVAAARVRAAATGQIGHRPLHASRFFVGASAAMRTVISGLRV